MQSRTLLVDKWDISESPGSFKEEGTILDQGKSEVQICAESLKIGEKKKNSPVEQSNSLGK